MATKTDCFFLNDNQKSFAFDNSQTVHDNQYSNLNLNQNLKWTAATLELSGSSVSDNIERRENPLHLNKPSKISDFSNLINDKTENEEFKKPWKKNISLNTINGNTLSLHIAAYENSVETDSFNGSKNKDWKKGKYDSIKNQKQFLTAAKFDFQNPFEFPRQENEGAKVPEVSKFKASQRLLNPNKASNLKKRMPGNSPSRKSNNQKPKGKSKEESMNSKITKSRQKSCDENLCDQKQLKNVKIAVAISSPKIPESSPTTNASPVLKNESKKASKMGKTKSKEYSGSHKKFKELQKRNNEREDQLLRRLNALFDDDCNVSGLKQAVALEHHLLKRLDYGLNDHMNLFKGNLTKSIEYLSVIQQYRRMQAHKMAILLDRIDEECKKTNQLLEEHFQDINCVYQLMKPDATPKELMLYVCRHFSRTFQSFCRWTTKKQK